MAALTEVTTSLDAGINAQGLSDPLIWGLATKNLNR